MANEIYHRSNWGNAVNDKYWADVYEKYSATNKMFIRSDYYENSNETDKLMADIYPKPSILLTPTAYDNGSLHSVKPVQSFGDNLNTNLDYTTFGINSGIKTVTNGVANISSTGANSYTILSYQNQGLIAKGYNQKYKVSGFIRNISATSVYIAFYNGSTQSNIVDFYTGNEFLYFEVIITTGSSSTQELKFNSVVTGANQEVEFKDISIQHINDADFDFTRGSSATRVNEKGLIEDVQILSGELVQNGDFEQIGSEEVTNGSFDTDSDWSKETGWTISDGKANANVTGTQAIYQSGITLNKWYKVTYTISDYVSGDVRLRVGTTSTPTVRSSNGTFTEYLYATGTNQIRISPFTGGFVGSIDNVSVKEVGQNWTFGDDITIQDNKAFFNNSAYPQAIEQTNVATIGNKYRVKFTVSDYQSGNVKLRHPLNIDDIQANGDYVFEGEAAYTSVVIRGDGSPNNFKIDNISVIEITEDTDLPRINYTNFDYENGVVVPYSGEGSLLLEPQSTNLVPYSEDFTQWTNSTTNLDVPSNVTQTNPSGGSESGFININNGVSATKFIYEPISTTSSIHTQSVFFKYHSRQWIQLVSGGTSHYANFDIQNGVVGNVSGCTATIKDYGNGWYKCTATLTSAATPINIAIVVLDDDATSRIPTSTGTGSYYVWGAQLEELSYATSYIPTEGSTVTRLQDVPTYLNISNFVDSTYAIYFDYKDATRGTVGSTANINYLYNQNNELLVYVYGTTLMLHSTTGEDYTSFDFNDGKIAINYDGTNVKYYRNGILIKTITASTRWQTSAGNYYLYRVSSNRKINYNSFGVFEALDNDQLERLTGEGYETFNLLAQANNYTII